MYPSQMMMSVVEQRSEEARQHAARFRRIRQARAAAAAARPERGRRAAFRRALATPQPQV